MFGIYLGSNATRFLEFAEKSQKKLYDRLMK